VLLKEVKVTSNSIGTPRLLLPNVETHRTAMHFASQIIA
jgi:hypothetical protein